MDRFEYLDGYEFDGCAVRRRSNISFFGTKWEDKDALDLRTTGIFIYYPEKPPERRWSYDEIGETTGVSGAAAFLPEERWVFVMYDGEVFVVGGGSADWEQRITKNTPAYFAQVRTIAGQYVYAVGIDRTVFRRDAKDKWIRLERGLPTNLDEEGTMGDIAGFSHSEIYICGGYGDLWGFDGRAWSRIDLPTNAGLRRICCGADDQTYIITDQRTVVVGRGTEWRIIEQRETKDILEEIVWFEDRIYISTANGLFEIVEGAFVPSRLQPPEQSSYTHLAARDGILVVASGTEACMYDGSRWTTIIESA